MYLDQNEHLKMIPTFKTRVYTEVVLRAQIPP